MEKNNKNRSKNMRRKALSLTIKRLSIEYKGGACNDCKNVFTPRVFCFHHLDDSKKKFEIKEFIDHFRARPKKFADIGYKLLLEELDKCDLLCHNCHQKIHEDEWYDEEADAVSQELILNNNFRELFNLKKIKKTKPTIRGKKL